MDLQKLSIKNLIALADITGLLTTYYLLPTTYYLLPTTYYLLLRFGQLGVEKKIHMVAKLTDHLVLIIDKLII